MVDDVVTGIVPFEVTENSLRPVTVGPSQKGWGGTANLTWTGNGPTSDGGTFTETGSSTITYVQDNSQPTDGVNFGLSARELQFSLTYDSIGKAQALPDGCTSQVSYHAAGSFDRAGTIQEENLLTIMPDGSYVFAIPGLDVNADFTQTDTITGCPGADTKTSTGTAPFAADGHAATGNVEKGATTITGGTTYTSGDGTINYTATWNLEKH